MSGISSHLMLTIDQISQLTGVRKSTLRYWEKSFEEFLKPGRTSSNRRKYSMEDLDRVKAIQYLLENEHLTAYGVRLRLQGALLRPRKRMAGKPNPGPGGKRLFLQGRRRTLRSNSRERSSVSGANPKTSCQILGLSMQR